jgi:hypothetical protein
MEPENGSTRQWKVATFQSELQSRCLPNKVACFFGFAAVGYRRPVYNVYRWINSSAVCGDDVKLSGRSYCYYYHYYQLNSLTCDTASRTALKQTNDALRPANADCVRSATTTVTSRHAIKCRAILRQPPAGPHSSPSPQSSTCLFVSLQWLQRIGFSHRQNTGVHVSVSYLSRKSEVQTAYRCSCQQNHTQCPIHVFCGAEDRVL